MKVLRLTLKKKWFDMIESGEKTEECREIEPYWSRRLFSRGFTHILFVNGHAKNARKMMFEFGPRNTAFEGFGNPEWGAQFCELYYVINIGRRVEI